MKRKISQIILCTSIITLSPSLLFAGNEYSATSFNLIGPSGRVTAQITSSAEGTPAIFFYDENSKVRLNLGIYPGGAPGVILMDKDGNAAAILRLTDDGHTPVLVMKEGGVDKKIIGLGQYDEKKTETTPSVSSAATIETMPIRTADEKKREYFLYAIAFGLGLVGAYVGGRIGTSSKRIQGLLEQNQKVSQNVTSTLVTNQESNGFQKRNEAKVSEPYSGSLLQKEVPTSQINDDGSSIQVKKITHGTYAIDTNTKKEDKLS